VAVKLNKPSMIRALVEFKANINATNKVHLFALVRISMFNIYIPLQFNVSALSLAVEEKNISLVAHKRI
jgi:hypothetical protein